MFCPENVTACPDCDLLQVIPPLPGGATAACPRCGRVIASGKHNSLTRALAFATAAAIALAVANATPLLGLFVVGRQAETTILGGALTMWRQGQEITALIVAFSAVIAPFFYITVMLTVLIAAQRANPSSWIGFLLRMAELCKPWAMVEVMMLGILVALVKIADLATVIPGIGMFAVFALIFFLAAMMVSFDPREVWSKIAWSDQRAQAAFACVQKKSFGAVFPAEATGGKLGLVSCHICKLLTKPFNIDHPGRCPRCGNPLEVRRSNMNQRVWALILAAAICYIPANLLPVMNTTTPTYAENDTIISGIILLYQTGSWPLALIVLIASVVIPLAKILALAYLLLTVQLRNIRGQKERTRLCQLVEIIGRWSMLDVFVVTFVVALVQLQPLMSVTPGAGILFFAAVVVLTMLAAGNFDPRLIWDAVASGKVKT